MSHSASQPAQERPVRLTVYVQPRASRTEIAGEYDGCVKIRLAAPPVDGEANEALVEFVAKRLKIAKRGVAIVSGVSSRRKVLEIEGVSEIDIQRIFPVA